MVPRRILAALMTARPDIFEEIVRLRREAIPAALATIVETRGSTPGRETMRLLVLADGTFLGTVGGGCLEAEVYDAALEVIGSEQPRTLQFRLTETGMVDSGLLCGGEVTVFVEPLTTPTLWIFGAGHVSRALCTVAGMAGFRVTIVDDRESYASTERFPDAADVLVAEFEAAALKMPVGPHSYAVIVTRGHKEDGTVLAALARRAAGGEEPRFLGMLGSSTKKKVLDKMLREGGVDPAFLERVRCPVGLHLGGNSHEEIAVAVAGELISVRRLGRDAAQAWEERRSERAEQRGIDLGSGSEDS